MIGMYAGRCGTSLSMFRNISGLAGPTLQKNYLINSCPLQKDLEDPCLIGEGWSSLDRYEVSGLGLGW